MWSDVGSNGMSLEGQLLTDSNLRADIIDGIWGLQHLKHSQVVTVCSHTVLLGDDAFSHRIWPMNPFSG